MATLPDNMSFGTMSLDYQAGIASMLKSDAPWTPRSFFDPPRVNAPELVEFGVGKTYDFFA
ncbi:MAG: hypothetical protein ING19_14715 [Azospirillum sp.]|jgi:hypothetical protein|nr:hypothetical protein [Azospirillum sp.]MCA3267311.1 hypothetical protein [Azospirillum sp.]MCZ8122603.1 hypothetical protein [Magnetospirillum sp.]